MIKGTTKMSSRTGNVILAQDLLDISLAKALALSINSKDQGNALAIGRIYRRIHEAFKNNEKTIDVEELRSINNQ